MNPSRLHIALAGNPNAGKTSIFNNLTGANQHVANYPGVTVETKEGACRLRGAHFRVVDLPGTYSLTANSPDEQIARNHLIRERPDASRRMFAGLRSRCTTPCECAKSIA